MKQYKHRVPLFTGKFSIIFTKKRKKFWRKYGKEILAEGFSAVMFVKPGHVYVAFDVSEELSPGIVAHECAHACNFIFEDHGAKLSTNYDEPYCYLLNRLVDLVYMEYNKYKNKK